MMLIGVQYVRLLHLKKKQNDVYFIIKIVLKDVNCHEVGAIENLDGHS